MSIGRRVGDFLGVGGDRGGLPPQYVALSDGLVVTETGAEAWYLLQSSNTDLMSETARDAEHDQAAAALAKTLAGYECHLRVLWSPLHAEDYRAEATELFEAGDWSAWADLRVERLEMLGLPTRHLLLGVRIAERATPAAASRRRRTRDLLGTGSAGISGRELSRLDALARRLGRMLETTPWRAHPAAVEMLSWMIMREQRRQQPLPSARDGLVSGAQLATLTRGRVVPYPDHLRVMGPDGSPSAWVSVLVMTRFPGRTESPGAGEWLRAVSDVTYVPDCNRNDMDPDALITHASPEVSMRFKVLPKRDALTKVERARRSAREQQRSAAQQSAEDAGRSVDDTEEAMSELVRDMEREDTTLVEDHPRLVVSSTESWEDLRARVDAVITYYGGLGIDVVVGEEEQRELWLETQPGDQLRVADLGHTRDVAALAGSWWWGGAHVGADEGPIVGYLTGTTSGTFRHDVTAGSDRGDATTTAYVGRAGRGKTTAMMLDMLNAAFRGAFALAFDLKGDLSGVVAAARAYGLNAQLVTADEQFAGVCDLFSLLGQDGSGQAKTEVAAQLVMALPSKLRSEDAETPINAAVNAVAEEPNPATWRVIENLRNHPTDSLAQRAGEALYELSRMDLGAPFMGRPKGVAPLSPQPGIYVIQIPGLSLPGMEVPQTEWNLVQRLSAALMHSLLAYGVSTAGRPDLRGLRKIVCVPEVHVLTATRDGARFLDYIARVGRALREGLLLDTQDPESLAKLQGVLEQLATVIGFQQTTEEQQDGLAHLLQLPPGEHSRSLIEAVGMLPDGEIRHGHCIVRDHRLRAATVQYDVPSAELLDLLDTTPDATGPDMQKQEAPA